MKTERKLCNQSQTFKFNCKIIPYQLTRPNSIEVMTLFMFYAASINFKLFGWHSWKGRSNRGFCTKDKTLVNAKVPSITVKRNVDPNKSLSGLLERRVMFYFMWAYIYVWRLVELRGFKNKDRSSQRKKPYFSKTTPVVFKKSCLRKIRPKPLDNILWSIQCGQRSYITLKTSWMTYYFSIDLVIINIVYSKPNVFTETGGRFSIMLQ